jgi:hypothetical protein
MYMGRLCIFIDSPYGDNIKYNDHHANIGNISSEAEKFYDELEKVISESHRVLKPGKVLGWLIGDQWVKRRFTPSEIRHLIQACGITELFVITSICEASNIFS